MRNEGNLYGAVIKNPLYGFYELAEMYRKKMDSFYKDEYFQNDYALYQKTKYDDLDVEHKNYFYSQKLYVAEKWGGVRITRT